MFGSMPFAVGLLRSAFLVALAVLWAAGLRLFLRSALTARRKIVWIGILLAIGVAVGLTLPRDAILHRFMIVLLALPLLAAIDLIVLRSKRTFSFWMQACGFEVCTVFATASAARSMFDLAGIAPFMANVVPV